MPESQLALSWDNFQQTMQTGIVRLLETEDLVDVTFCVEGKKLKAHKMILSVCSPFFKELFESNPCQHPIIFLNDVKYRVMKDLLAYMYKGEVLLTQELLPAFVRLGESLQIRGLTNEEPAGTQQPRTSSAADHLLLNQRIFAESLPIHTVPTSKSTGAPIIRRTLATTRQCVGGVRRSANSMAECAIGHLPLKRPKLAPHMTNKPRFVLESGKLSKVEKVDEEDLLDELEGEDGHIDDLSQLDHIQHNYSYTTTTNSKQPSTSISKQRRKSITSPSDASATKSTRTAAAIIDPMEMELAIIHQGLESSTDHHQQQRGDSEEEEEDDAQHRVIIGGGGEEDIVLEQELSQDDDDCGDMGEGDEENAEDMDGDEMEHKLMMEGVEGEAELHTDDVGGTGDEESKEEGDMTLHRTVRKQEMPRYIVDGFVFHVNIMKGNPPMTYLRCLEYKRLGCHARAVMPTNGSIQDIQLTQMHNHPPDFAAEEKIVFMRELKDFIMRHMNLSTKEVYDLLQPIYPTAAHETPYETIKNKMGRWKRSFIIDNEMDIRLSGMETTPEATLKKRPLKTEIIIPD